MLDRASLGMTFCTVLVIALLTVEIELEKEYPEFAEQ